MSHFGTHSGFLLGLKTYEGTEPVPENYVTMKGNIIADILIPLMGLPSIFALLT